MIDILYEDQDLRVLNKPANVSLLADRKGEPNLWDTLKATGEKPFLIHRLDKGTSGVLLTARNQQTQSKLTRAFAAREVHKFYLANVVGSFPGGSTQHINLPLCKGRKSRYRIAAERNSISRDGNQYTVVQDREGVVASTRARLLSTTADRSRLLLMPVTGRTHQLRVHLSWLRHAICGDHLYGRPGGADQVAPRLQLHCHKVVVPGWGPFTAPSNDFYAGSSPSDC